MTCPYLGPSFNLRSTADGWHHLDQWSGIIWCLHQGWSAHADMVGVGGNQEEGQEMWVPIFFLFCVDLKGRLGRESWVHGLTLMGPPNLPSLLHASRGIPHQGGRPKDSIWGLGIHLAMLTGLPTGCWRGSKMSWQVTWTTEKTEFFFFFFKKKKKKKKIKKKKN